VVFRRELPPIGDALGTKVNSPCKSREEAVEAAREILACIVAIAPPRADA
jgi:hypothetical protein